MNTTLMRITALAATVALVSAQGVGGKGGGDAQDLPCHPCLAPGSCAPVDPLTSAGDFSCQNHAKHVHRRLVLAASDFSSVEFGQSDLRGTEFYACTFQDARFYAADFSFGRMNYSDAERVVMPKTQAVNADFSMSSLRHGYFVGANFAGAQLLADFAFANLRQVDFTGAVLSIGPNMTDFCSADLTDAVGLNDTVGIAVYSPCTNFTGTGFDPVAGGWMLLPGAEIGERYCSPATVNSTGNSAELIIRGCGDLAFESLELRAFCLPGNEFGLFLASQTPDFVRHPGASGALCLGGEIGTFPYQVQNTGTTGELLVDLDVDEVPRGLRVGFAAGETWYFQAWFRDWMWIDGELVRSSFFTDAVAVTFD